MGEGGCGPGEARAYRTEIRVRRSGRGVHRCGGKGGFDFFVGGEVECVGGDASDRHGLYAAPEAGVADCGGGEGCGEGERCCTGGEGSGLAGCFEEGGGGGGVSVGDEVLHGGPHSVGRSCGGGGGSIGEERVCVGYGCCGSGAYSFVGACGTVRLHVSFDGVYWVE